MTLSATDQAAVNQAAARYGIPPDVLAAMALRETGGVSNPDTYVNPSSGATGFLQVLPSTAANPGYGVAPLAQAQLTDPYAEANFAGAYLSALSQAKGGLAPAINQYSGGNYQLSDLTASSSSATPATAGATPAPSPTSTSTAGIMSGAWEVAQRGMVFFAGLALVLVALIALLMRSKTVQTTLQTAAVAAV